MLSDFKSVAVGVEREEVPGAVVGALFGFLQYASADFGNAAQVLPNIVAFDGKMRRGFVIPAVVRVQFVAFPQMQLIWAKLHPRGERAIARHSLHTFHAQFGVECGRAFDVADGNKDVVQIADFHPRKFKWIPLPLLV